MLDTLDVKWRVIAFDKSTILLRAVGQLKSRALHAHPCHAIVELGADPGSLVTSWRIYGACCTSPHSPAIPFSCLAGAHR